MCSIESAGEITFGMPFSSVGISGLSIDFPHDVDVPDFANGSDERWYQIISLKDCVLEGTLDMDFSRNPEKISDDFLSAKNNSCSCLSTGTRRDLPLLSVQIVETLLELLDSP